jgi:hypothetical protein
LLAKGKNPKYSSPSGEKNLEKNSAVVFIFSFECNGLWEFAFERIS